MPTSWEGGYRPIVPLNCLEALLEKALTSLYGSECSNGCTFGRRQQGSCATQKGEVRVKKGLVLLWASLVNPKRGGFVQ